MDAGGAPHQTSILEQDNRPRGRQQAAQSVQAMHVVAGVEVLETLAFLRHMVDAARCVGRGEIDGAEAVRRVLRGDSPATLHRPWSLKERCEVAAAAAAARPPRLPPSLLSCYYLCRY